tara:strand:+ start:367 stop:747 length:381 start_codon:yes stop_codon:yes gene_type:complete
MAYSYTIAFDYDINTSLQVGDKVYKTYTSSIGGFDQNPSNKPTHIGDVLTINSTRNISITCPYMNDDGTPDLTYTPDGNDYLSFSKNRIVNNNDLLGYYASVKFVNNSPNAAKLWAVGSGVTENSK